MQPLLPYLRNRWDELLITCIYLNAFVASIFTWDALKVLAVSLGGLVLLAVIFGLRALWNRRIPPLRGQNIAFQVPRRGLVFTVGYQSDTISMAIRHQKPEYIGFICSVKTESIVNQLLEEFSYDEEHYMKKPVNPQDIKEIRTETGLILNWLSSKGLNTSDIAVDITGGTTTMSVGVFSMTEERRVDSQYIFCRQYENNKCVDGTQEAVFVSRYS
jgi:hypothetical protein